MTATISEAAVLSEAGARSDNTDRQLLDRFVAHGDQGAFAELVARHGACVWAVCRRVLGQEQDAEDAFQAVFLILARRAGAIRQRESLGSWLHGVAYHTATKVRRAAARRQTREQHAGGAAPEPPPPDQAAARELQRLLDEEVTRLAEKYRTPFVLCCLEGLTRVEAAKELGWSEGTVSSRLAQARTQLKARLAQRGFTLSAVLTACALAEGPASAATPVALAHAALHAGIAGHAVTAFSPTVAALADGIQRALLITKLKSAVAGLMLVFVASAAGFAAYQMYPPTEENAPVVQEKPAPPPFAAAAPGKPNDVWSAVISRDGKFAAAGAGWWDQPGEIAVWEMDTQKRLLHAVEAKGVGCVAFSPDDQYLASASWTGSVRLRAAPSWKEVANFNLPGVSRGIAFSPDGSLLAAATERRTIHVIDVAKRKILYELGGDLMRFHCVAFSPDGKRLLAGGGEWERQGPCQVTIWDLESKKQVGKLIGHEFAVICLTFAPDGKTIATGAVDTTIRLWDADTCAEIKVLRTQILRIPAAFRIGECSDTYPYWIESVEFSPDGKTLVSGARDGSLRFWDVKEGKETAKLGGAPQTPANRGEDVPPGGDTGVVPPQWRFTSAVRALRYSPAGDRLLVGGGPRTLGIFDAATHKEVAIFWDGPPPQGVRFAAQGLEAKHNDGVPAKDEEKPKPRPAPPPRNWPERVDIPFDKGPDAQAGLHLFGPIDAANVKGEPQGLRVTLPATRDHVDDVGVEARKVLRGDFEITLAYDLVAIARPAPKWGAGVILQIRFDTPDDAMANVTRTLKGKGASFGSTYFAVGDAGTHVRHPLQYPKANEKIRSGRLRLNRTGNDLAFQVDEGAGFRVIASKEVGGADVVSVHVLATTGKEPFPVDVRFPSLELRWDPASKVAAAPPVPERAQKYPHHAAGWRQPRSWSG